MLQLLGKTPELSIFQHTSLSQCKRNEQEKKRAYDQCIREVEHGVFSTSGGMGPKSNMAYKTIASMIAQKHDKTYSKTFHWIRCKLSYSLLHSAIMCLRGEKIQHSPPCKYPQTQLTSPAMKARSLLCELNPQTLIPLVYTLHLCICVKEATTPPSTRRIVTG